VLDATRTARVPGIAVGGHRAAARADSARDLLGQRPILRPDSNRLGTILFGKVKGFTQTPKNVEKVERDIFPAFTEHYHSVSCIVLNPIQWFVFNVAIKQ